uniref:Uncharacterized protein n=1 Tax=Trichobilharzia regenti TaxID=157069 RepID=A0AA85J6I1_TRIRE|nr:unnamed protein product [Trichobilharzia regenti]
MQEVNMNQKLKDTNLPFTAAVTCLRKYITFTCLMHLMTMITTTCVAYFVLGAVPVSLLFVITKLREKFPYNELLISLSVLLWSFALPAVTKSMGLSIFAPWTITIILAVVTLLFGYRTEKRSTKVSITLLGVAGGITVLGITVLIAFRITGREVTAVILSGIILAIAVLLVLYLTGQGIKRCNNETTKTLLSMWLALITWVGSVYLFISIAVMFIEGRTATHHQQKNHVLLL